MKIKHLISSLIFLFSCTFYSPNILEGSQVDSIIAKIGKKLAKKYDLEFSGIGGSMKNDKENILLINFHHIGKSITIEDSRKIIVEITEEVVSMFNKEIIKKKLQKELFCFPFNTWNIHTTVFSFSEMQKAYRDPYIIYVESMNDKILICTKDPEIRFKYKQQIEEPYIDAVIKYKGADYASTAVTCQIKGAETESDKK